MPSVYDTQARKRVRELIGKSVLVREPQPIAEGLEVPQYFTYYVISYGNIGFQKYSPAVSTGCEMLYIGKGENESFAELAALILPDVFPKTYAFLLKMHGTEHEIGSKINTGLRQSSERHDLITKTGIGKFIISKEVRKDRIVPDCLNIQTSNVDSPFTVRQL